MGVSVAQVKVDMADDNDDEPLCAAPGGDNAVGIAVLQPGTRPGVMIVLNCVFGVLFLSLVALCFTDLPWYHTAMMAFLGLGLFVSIHWFASEFQAATGRSIHDPLGEADTKKSR